ncbi:MAG: hypothetical protein HYY95_07905 [Candidatus Rokubacteria bacterium]|nr:hypothetical protein [Candidatus Rokubacteria bacterium]MBI3105480.1 hypothetical protein [Candidatus Rokubacteria bacterium]
MRVFRDHRGPLARGYRHGYLALLAGLGIDGDALLRREAARVALLSLRAGEAARVWAELVEQRRAGRGRRPSPRQVERAARRAALDDASAAQALATLRALAARGRRSAVDPALARLRGGAA